MSDPDRLEEVDIGDYWSSSKLSTIFECGAKFWYDYLAREKKHRGSALRFGSIVHTCLERMHKEDIWEDGAVQRLWADSWLPTIDQIDWDNEYTPQRVYKARGLKMLMQYKDAHRNDEILELEKRFKFEHDSIRLGGIIDKIVLRDGVPAIVDYKTSKWTPDPLVLRADHQLTIYYIASKQLGYSTNRLAIHNLLDGTEYWTTRNDDDIDLLMECIREAQKRIEHQMYARNISFHCRTCSFKNRCLGSIGSKDSSSELSPTQPF